MTAFDHHADAQPAADAGATPDPAAAVPPPGPYAARGGSYYRNVRILIGVVLVLMGGWFLYDGFIGYPAENERYNALQAQIEQLQSEGKNEQAAELVEEQKDYTYHPYYSGILPQLVLGFLLPPLGVVLLIWWLRRSRGEIRLDADDVLHFPGHPPIPASAITEIDDELWDRKGIGGILYDVEGRRGKVKLDDFVYDREPIDKIHDRLVYLVTGEVPAAPAAPGDDAPAPARP